MTDTVSIYIPTRNRRRLLERAINSVVRQTYENIEIIVVDDCSTDDTQEYLNALSKQEPRLIALRMETPRGAPAARNRAIDIATGRFITGLDDDDEFRADRIKLFVSRWQSLGATATTLACLFTESVLTDGVTSKITGDRKDQVAYLDLFEHNFIGNQIFCPRERILKLGGFDESMPAWQDLEMFIRLLKSYGQAQLLSEPTYICYVDRGRDRISTNAHRRYAAFEKILKKHTDVPIEYKQQLFLELFSAFYGTIPTLSDWRRMLAWRTHPKLIGKLFRADIRNRIRRYV